MDINELINNLPKIEGMWYTYSCRFKLDKYRSEIQINGIPTPHKGFSIEFPNVKNSDVKNCTCNRCRREKYTGYTNIYRGSGDTPEESMFDCTKRLLEREHLEEHII